MRICLLKVQCLTATLLIHHWKLFLLGNGEVHLQKIIQKIIQKIKEAWRPGVIEHLLQNNYVLNLWPVLCQPTRKLGTGMLDWIQIRAIGWSVLRDLDAMDLFLPLSIVIGIAKKHCLPGIRAFPQLEKTMFSQNKFSYRLWFLLRFLTKPFFEQCSQVQLLV